MLVDSEGLKLLSVLTLNVTNHKEKEETAVTKNKIKIIILKRIIITIFLGDVKEFLGDYCWTWRTSRFSSLKREESYD